MGDVRHFLDLDRLEADTLRDILEIGASYKAGRLNGRPLEGKTLAMIFEKPSTRTRVSFEVGMRQLGGEIVVLEHHDTQLGRGETIGDTARVLSRYVDAILLRTDMHEKLTELASLSGVPVINGLTDRSHPCQLMADVMTLEEQRGSLDGQAVAWCGDLSNVAMSWVHAAVRFGLDLRLACPPDQSLSNAETAWIDENGGRVRVTHDAAEAAEGADCIVTDTWVSMGHEAEAARLDRFTPFRVDEALMARAKPDAIFMHCLPAHRGQEVTAGVIDGPRSVVWDEAENRLHAQKGILTWCLA
ncbi:MAG: ornithine carbamoyltransferase [Rhodospirillaceae bacterium]|jgi:ornithine carbamoyltransferase|nr:ornithine carbamoyltransferase [Rhodospirillaceae bacterium]